MPRVIHFEIPAEDPARAVDFYRAVFGWKIEKWSGPQDYWLVTAGAGGEPGINGGLIRRMGLPPLDMQPVNAYVCTIDAHQLDEYVEKTSGAGGRMVVPKMPIPGVGWPAYCKDTEGNIFGKMQADAKAG